MSCILDSNHPEEFEQEFIDDSDFSERESDASASHSVVDSDEQSVESDVGDDFVHRDLRSSRMMYCGECKIRNTTVIMTRSYTED